MASRSLRLKVVNRTTYDARDIRRFLSAGMRAKGVEWREVEIYYGKGSALHGWGVLGTEGDCNRHGITIRLTLPPPAFVAECRADGRDPVDYRKLAQIFEHEIDHTLGLNHKNMIDWWTLEPTWHEGLTIKFAEPEVIDCATAARQRAAAREEHVRAMLKKAETRLRRAKSIRDKWARKAGYYDRKENRSKTVPSNADTTQRSVPSSPDEPAPHGAEIQNDPKRTATDPQQCGNLVTAGRDRG
jgi:hypothetical protein